MKYENSRKLKSPCHQLLRNPTFRAQVRMTNLGKRSQAKENEVGMGIQGVREGM